MISTLLTLAAIFMKPGELIGSEICSSLSLSPFCFMKQKSKERKGLVEGQQGSKILFDPMIRQ